ncbi:MAG: hypothetical protein ABL894_04740 [Hyphomicrobium sp.]
MDMHGKIKNTHLNPPWFGASIFRFGGQLAICLFSAWMAAAVPAAYAQDEPPSEEKIKEEKMREAVSKVPNVGNGLELSRKLCTSCHLIGEPPNAPTPADVPSFARIANRAEQSQEKLANWLMAPHQPMPDPHLSRNEIRDLAGYILSLRTGQ